MQALAAKIEDRNKPDKDAKSDQAKSKTEGAKNSKAKKSGPDAEKNKIKKKKAKSTKVTAKKGQSAEAGQPSARPKSKPKQSDDLAIVPVVETLALVARRDPNDNKDPLCFVISGLGVAKNVKTSLAQAQSLEIRV